MCASSEAEVEFHVCNYWTTGSERFIWGGKKEWGNLTHSPDAFFFCLFLLYSKRNRRGWTVNEMIHNMKEVNIRERDGVVNKCRHQKDLSTVYTQQERLQYINNDSLTHTKSYRRFIKPNESRGFILHPGLRGDRRTTPSKSSRRH